MLMVLVLAGCGSSDQRDPLRRAGETGSNAPAPSPGPAHPAIRVSRPAPDQVVTSPLIVAGEARGTWYFEASFPVKLVDAEGRVLAMAPAEAKGEWMTPEFVPFEVSLTFSSTTRTGTLVLEKSNASGLPEHADSVRVPVRF